MPAAADQPWVALTTAKGALGFLHCIESTNSNGSSRALCGRWGRQLDVEVDGLSHCPNCTKVAAMKIGVSK